MKKFYSQPTIEQELVLVEAGIALSGDVYEDLIIEDGASAGYLEENIW